MRPVLKHLRNLLEYVEGQELERGFFGVELQAPWRDGRRRGGEHRHHGRCGQGQAAEDVCLDGARMGTELTTGGDRLVTGFALGHALWGDYLN